MSSAPLPTTLTLLSQLPDHASGSKLRFLGRVTSYSPRKGILELQHSYISASSYTVLALVDIDLLLENMEREDMEVGAWVNVIGYRGNGLTGQDVDMGRGKKRIQSAEVGNDGRVVRVAVKAVMLWNAGAVDVAQYEKAVEQRLELGRGIKR
ncbi:MAG: hypothetical protein Q9163_003389 [Psora crenata]